MLKKMVVCHFFIFNDLHFCILNFGTLNTLLIIITISPKSDIQFRTVLKK